MPDNGDINTKFGVYKSLCCGEEIVITEGKEFPECPNHPKLSTIWKPVNDDKFIRVGKNPADPAP